MVKNVASNVSTAHFLCLPQSQVLVVRQVVPSNNCNCVGIQVIIDNRKSPLQQLLLIIS